MRSIREEAGYANSVLEHIEAIVRERAPVGTDPAALQARVDNVVRIHCAEKVDDALAKLQLRASE
jgi:hypothetical protein